MSSEKNSWHGFLEEGVQHLSKGHYSEAGFWFEAAHRLEPSHPLTCYALGRERMRQGRFYEAETLLRQAFDADPDLLPAAFCLVRLMGLHLDRRHEARELLEQVSPKADELQQEDVVLLLKGELELVQPEGFKDAACTFGKLLERGQRNDAAKDGLARAHNLEGIDLARRGRCDEALFVLKKSSDLSPGWAAPRVNMGAVFQSMGKPQRACQEYRRALVLEPENPTALYNLGKLYLKLGRLERAAGCYRRLLDHFPFYPGVRAALAELVRKRRGGRL